MRKISFIVLLMLTIYCVADNIMMDEYSKLKDETKNKVNKAEYEEIFMGAPDTFQGQSALLDLAKIELLERNYDQALKYFKKIFHPEIPTKEYWMAKCYLSSGDTDSAIIAAQNYVYTSSDKDKIESSYFIIAEAYIEKGLFTKALNTLNYLRNSDNIQNNIPLLHYKIGYCNEKLGNYDTALTHYKKLKLDFPYHEYTYLAEDRIYQMNSDKKIDVDLKEIMINEDPVKEPIADKDDEGNKYLQVGAFSKQGNADKHGKDISKTFSGNYIVFPKKSNNKTLYITAFGPYNSDKQLNKAKSELEKNGYNSFMIQR